jgi:ABC-type long-subunit fatty acid transport system fused permease/ATPase subunit
MVWVAVLYALAGSLLTHFIGRPLIGLKFARQQVEADFRFGLVRLRENADNGEEFSVPHAAPHPGTALANVRSC